MKPSGYSGTLNTAMKKSLLSKVRFLRSSTLLGDTHFLHLHVLTLLHQLLLHLPMSSLNSIRPHILSCWLHLDSVPCFGFIFLHQVTFISFLLSILILFLYLFSIVYKVSYFISHIVTVAPPSRSHPFLLGSPARCVSYSLNVSINLFRIPC
jgi:hypothetical protein